MAPGLAQCCFLAVPSYPLAYTAQEFTAQALTDARRYGRPVLWADVATFPDKQEAGGSSMHVDEGPPADLSRFPSYLELSSAESTKQGASFDAWRGTDDGLDGVEVHEPQLP